MRKRRKEEKEKEGRNHKNIRTIDAIDITDGVDLELLTFTRTDTRLTLILLTPSIAHRNDPRDLRGAEGKRRRKEARVGGGARGDEGEEMKGRKDKE